LEVCGPRAAAAHGHACLLMMDCDGRVRVAASDPMTVMQSWVRGWYLCLGAAAHRSTSFAASIGHRRQHQHQHQHQHQRQCLLLRRVWPAGGVCASTNARVRERNSRCVCQYCSVHVTCLSTWRIGGSDQQSRVLSVLSCTVCTAVSFTVHTDHGHTLLASRSDLRTVLFLPFIHISTVVESLRERGACGAPPAWGKLINSHTNRNTQVTAISVSERCALFKNEHYHGIHARSAL
jgi:hypothetical protein